MNDLSDMSSTKYRFVFLRGKFRTLGGKNRAGWNRSCSRVNLGLFGWRDPKGKDVSLIAQKVISALEGKCGRNKITEIGRLIVIGCFIRVSALELRKRLEHIGGVN
jgi:hypothetical protein